MASAQRRDDLIALTQLLVGIETAILRTVAALNRIHRSHRLPKWQRAVIGQCHIAPERLGQRLGAIWNSSPSVALAEAETLLRETVALAQAHAPVDLGAFEHSLQERREPTPTA